MPTDDRITIDTGLVRRLIATQFPQWSGLPVEPVPWSGWDNHTFRLGEAMTVRLPSAARYAAAVEKEHRWLPVLAPRLPLPIPVPLAAGAPGAGYPFPWSVYRWQDGETAATERIADPRRFALDVATLLKALQAIDASDGPMAGDHNFVRGGDLAAYDEETRRTIALLGDAVDGVAATAVWDAALAARWHGPPVWVHGDIAIGNLIVRDGRLAAVIDFGSSAVGDPACDLVLAWTFLRGKGREAFRAGRRGDVGARPRLGALEGAAGPGARWEGPPGGGAAYPSGRRAAGRELIRSNGRGRCHNQRSAFAPFSACKHADPVEVEWLRERARRVDMARPGIVSMSNRSARCGPLCLAVGAVAVAVCAPWAPARAADVVFGAPQRVVGTANADAEPPQVAVAGKAVYLAWHEFPTAGNNQPDVYFSRSTNNGASFTARVNLSNSAAADSRGEQVAVAGKNVAVVWVETDPVSFLSEIYVRTSTDGGVSFKPRKKITGTGNPNTPRVAVAGANVFIAWQADGQAGNPDIYFAQSSNAGNSFSLRRNVSRSDGTSEFRDQGLRQTAVSDNKLVVTWRDDSIAGAGYEIFVAQAR